MTTAVCGASSYALLAVGTVFSFDVDIPMLSFHKCDCICILFWLEYNTQYGSVLEFLGVLGNLENLLQIIVFSEKVVS